MEVKVQVEGLIFGEVRVDFFLKDLNFAFFYFLVEIFLGVLVQNGRFIFRYEIQVRF